MVHTLDMRVTIPLKLENIGGSEKVDHMQENCVPILYAM